MATPLSIKKSRNMTIECAAHSYDTARSQLSSIDAEWRWPGFVDEVLVAIKMVLLRGREEKKDQRTRP